MIKVGIMSMQRIANYGSFLQAYGLKQMLEELGCDVHFVDYHPGATLVCADGGTGLVRKIAKGIKAFCYKVPLKEKIRFIQYKKNFAKKNYPHLGISDEMNYYPELDILVIGSDEVFNCVQSNTNVGFSPELFGENNNAKKVISYGASFGNTTIDKLEMYHVEKKVGEWLKRFDMISVRDNNSIDIVRRLAKRMPEKHVDPVLAYDFVEKCQIIPTFVSEKKYMILYGYSGRFSKDECREIRSYARAKGLQVICIGGVQNVCDKFVDCNPFEVIAYFNNAECVVTDTFHGTILSVITHKPFVVCVRNSGYGNAEKLLDLLNTLSLEERICCSLGDLSIIIENSINYEMVDKTIEIERKEAYKYLQAAIERL